MTLLIAYLLMAQAEAHPAWYPVVFVLWLLHIATMSPPTPSAIIRKMRGH